MVNYVLGMVCACTCLEYGCMTLLVLGGGRLGKGSYSAHTVTNSGVLNNILNNIFNYFPNLYSPSL